MPPPLVTVLLVLYGLAGLAFVGWTALGSGTPPTDPMALPLPVWAMLAAAAVNLSLAIGIWRRGRIVRGCAIALHALVTATALGFLLLHATNLQPSPAEHPYAELIAKSAVHATVTLLWWRSRSIQQWFAG